MEVLRPHAQAVVRRHVRASARAAHEELAALPVASEDASVRLEIVGVEAHASSVLKVDARQVLAERRINSEAASARLERAHRGIDLLVVAPADVAAGLLHNNGRLLPQLRARTEVDDAAVEVPEEILGNVARVDVYRACGLPPHAIARKRRRDVLRAAGEHDLAVVADSAGKHQRVVVDG